jgi:hypothetical protein
MSGYTIYEFMDGYITQVGMPRNPKHCNFVIQYRGMDWSGFRCLDECLSQLKQIAEDKPNKIQHFTIVEK